MADPVTITALITGLVGVYKAYAEYKATVAKADAKQAPAPAKSEQATKGEQTAPIIKAGVEQYGDADERADLASFERNPARYEDAMARVLHDIAGREPAFASRLQTLARQANIQSGGVQVNINVSDEGKVDQAAGINFGTMTYNAGPDSDE